MTLTMINRITLQALVVPLVRLRMLDLSSTDLGYLPPYATHKLSQMTALTSLSFSCCLGALASHIAPLYTITSLK